MDHRGHDPGNVALRPGDTPNVVDLALGCWRWNKTEHKSRSPNRAFPHGLFKVKCSTGHYRQNSITFGHQGQKCVSDHYGSDFFNGSDFFRPNTVDKIKTREAKSREAGLNNALLEQMIFI